MPVGVKKIGKKWRVTEGGKPATNKAGTSVDGGGHSSKKAAVAQARAINANLKERGKI